MYFDSKFAVKHSNTFSRKLFFFNYHKASCRRKQKEKIKSNIPVKTVVCVYCEDTYHVSDFNNKFKLRNEQRPLVVCPDHNLTSKIGDHVLTEEVKMLIAQIKAAKEEQIKEQILKKVMENSKIANNDSEEYEN